MSAAFNVQPCIDSRAAMLAGVTVSAHDASEARRCAEALRRRACMDLAQQLEMFASYEGDKVTCAYYDAMKTAYRQWLVFDLPAVQS